MEYMTQIASIKGHFDGTSVVLDEPARLAVGQEVRVIVDPISSSLTPRPTRPSLVGFAKGTFQMRADFNDPLNEFAEYQ